MTSPVICVDASVIVRLVAPSPESECGALWANWMDSGNEAVAPSLLRYEVSNALYRRFVSGNVNADLAKTQLETALELPITYYDDPWLTTRALELAMQFKMKATYDAHYLALSEHLGCALWTTDKRFFNTVHADCNWIRLADGQ